MSSSTEADATRVGDYVIPQSYSAPVVKSTEQRVQPTGPSISLRFGARTPDTVRVAIDVSERDRLHRVAMLNQKLRDDRDG